MKKPDKVLIVKIGALGDVAMALILLKAFKGKKVTWVTGRGLC